MTTATRRDPLQYLTDELEALKTQGLYRRLRILDEEQRAHTTFDGPASSISPPTTISA